MLVGDSSGLQDFSQEELRAYINTNAEAFKLARLGFAKQSRVPIEYSVQYIQTLLPELTVLKRLAISLAAEGRLAEMEGRTNEAVRIYLDVVRLGHEAARGGLLIDNLSGVACQAIGHRSLQDLKLSLDALTCRETIEALAELDAKAETTDQILSNERNWSRRTYGWKMRLAVMLTSARMLKTGVQKAEQRLKDNQRQRRLLMLDLATRAYELEKGERPKRLTDLVPAYLKAIPQDPNTGTNIVYQP